MRELSIEEIYKLKVGSKAFLKYSLIKKLIEKE